MAKTQKTAAELAQMIREQLGTPNFVKVFPNETYGWVATVMGAPSTAIERQASVDRICQELRVQYDLRVG